MNIQRPLVIGIDAQELRPGGAGVARYLREGLRALAKLPGLQEWGSFVLFSMSDARPDPGLPAPMFEPAVIRVRPARFAVYLTAALPLAAWRRKVDLLWFPSYMLPFTWRGHSIVTICDVSFERHPEWFRTKDRLAYRTMARHAARRADHILTISEFSRREIIDVYDAVPDRVTAIRLGVDARFNQPDDQRRKDARRHLASIGIDKDFFISFGQQFTRRHIIESLHAFETIAPRFSGLQFLVAGPDATHPPAFIDRECDAVNRRLGRRAIVRCAEYLPEELLPAILAEARATVWLSEYEGFGFPPIEALFCGTPSIIGDYEVRHETVGDRAFVVKNPGSVDAIADAMRRAVEDEEARQNILSGVDAMRSHFSWNGYAEKLRDVLQHVMSGIRS